MGAGPVIAIVWEFRVRRDMLERFAHAYGPSGDWELLFRQGDGFVSTELLADRDDRTRFLTIDKWTSPAAYDAFQKSFAKEYAAIDARTEAFTLSETKIGAFEIL